MIIYIIHEFTCALLCPSDFSHNRSGVGLLKPKYTLQNKRHYFIMQGMKRFYKTLLDEYLSNFACVAIVGPRQCGKTTFLGELGKQWKRFDLERASDTQIIAHDPDLFFRLNPRQVAIDECQLLPALFPALRVAIDETRNETGRFVITGSSSPDLLKSISESLAGRIGIIEMAPFAWAEVYPVTETPFARVLMDRQAQAADFLDVLRPRGDLQSVHDYWFRGGYPEPWIKGSDRFRQLWMDQYTRTYLERDVGRLFPGLDQQKFRLFLRMLGGLSGSIINYSEVGRSLGVSAPTARDYFKIADGTFIWRHVPSYTRSAMKRVVRHPKGFVRDSGLLHYLLRIPDIDALLGHPQAGRSWEGMVTEEIIRQLSSQGGGFDVYFYRTAAGAEIDLILEGDFGLIPVEIKHSQTVEPRELRVLSEFIRERSCRFGLVINNDLAPRRYTENIVGVPFSHL